jgi:hypothetical protein
LQLDSTSSALVVATNRCKNCPRSFSRYAPSKSESMRYLQCKSCESRDGAMPWRCQESTNKCVFDAQFRCNLEIESVRDEKIGPRSAMNRCASKGVVYDDFVALSTVDANLPIFGVTVQSEDFGTRVKPTMDGFFGLNWAELGALSMFVERAEPPLYDGFGLCIARRYSDPGDSTPAGRFVLGNVDERLAADGDAGRRLAMRRSDEALGSGSHYQLVGGVRELAIGGADDAAAVVVVATAEQIAEHVDSVVVDPSYHAFGMPAPLYDALIGAFIEHFGGVDNFWPTPLFAGECVDVLDEDVALLPTIRVRIDEHVELTLEPGSYVLWNALKTKRCLALAPIEQPRTIIVGRPLLFEHYVHIDRAGQAIALYRKHPTFCGANK